MSSSPNAPVTLGAERQTLLRWLDHPEIMVRELFDATPDPWQDEILEAFPHRPRQAMKASKGPGKSCCMAWLAWNFLLTRAHCNIGATSISGKNLEDGLWKEMAVWRNRAPLLQREFDLTSERIFHKAHRGTWFMSARTWPKAATVEEMGNTLAGLHADNVLYLIDEAGSIPVAILAAAEAALANAINGNEAHVVIAGNTNLLEGALYEACVRQAKDWHVVNISGDPDDPKRSTRVSKEWAQSVIDRWGRDSPFVKVMILGEWPESSVNALLSANDVEAACKRVYQEHDIELSPRVLGVDVARNGLAKSVMFPRQGLVAFKPHVMRNVTGVHGAGAVSRVYRDWDLDACFIDATGGFGASWIDQLHVLKRNPIGIHFAQKAEDPTLYYNRRSEMHVRMANWIKTEGGMLPPDVPELLTELPAITYTFKGDRLLIEPKELVEERIGYSPDHSDALCLTFASEVAPRKVGAAIPFRRREERYDPFREMLKVR